MGLASFCAVRQRPNDVSAGNGAKTPWGLPSNRKLPPYARLGQQQFSGRRRAACSLAVRGRGKHWAPCGGRISSTGRPGQGHVSPVPTISSRSSTRWVRRLCLCSDHRVLQVECHGLRRLAPDPATKARVSRQSCNLGSHARRHFRPGLLSSAAPPARRSCSG